MENNGHSIVLKLEQPTQEQINSQGQTLNNGDNKNRNQEHLLGSVIGEQSANSLLMNELQTPSLVISEQLGLGNPNSGLPDSPFASLGAQFVGQFGMNRQNNGSPEQPRIGTLSVWSGPLSYSYTLHSLHLHFGRSDDLGSEHFISGFQFPAEVRTHLC